MTKQTQPPGVTIQGKHYAFDSLTLDELEEIENKCGAAFDDLDLGRASVIKQVVFTFMRRDNPKLTLKTVGALQIGQLSAANGALAETRA